MVVNNAGIALLDKFVDTKLEDFNKSMMVNVGAPMLVSQLAARNMMDRGVPGSIVNVSRSARGTNRSMNE